uniref:SH3 domain-containing protein n=1 Tax=Heterorhabditis bacteriophora TaxID=37862 RepID=A0A1I7W6X9_HETBA
MMSILDPAHDAAIDAVDSVLLARAKYNFSGKNNDELTFMKNDIITVTQQLDGGWWEGTLSGSTGWFPSNYVVEINERGELLIFLNSIVILNEKRYYIFYKICMLLNIILRDILEQTLSTLGKDMQMLISGLSEPFRHLEKYPTMLQELERNMQDAHVDRGNIQRSCAVYKELKVLCEAIRKQKELQLELLYTGQVEGWADFEERGRILYVGIGGVVHGGETRDRFLYYRPSFHLSFSTTWYSASHMRFNHELEMILPEGVDEIDKDEANAKEIRTFKRSVPPHRSHQAILQTGKKSVKMRKGVCLTDQDDALLLRIVEGYCNGAARAVISSMESQLPQLIVAGDEKMLVEEIIGDEIVIQEKSLVDTVYALRDQVAGLRQDLATIAKNLEKEQKARRRLEETVRRGSTLLSSSQIQSSKFGAEMSSSQ